MSAKKLKLKQQKQLNSINYRYLSVLQHLVGRMKPGHHTRLARTINHHT